MTRIPVVAGLRGAAGLVTDRPFRAPHHTVSAAGLRRRREPAQPGEATLAPRGVLFLDQLSSSPRPSLEALRQPLEDGHVTIVRGQQVIVFPTRFMLVAASNPCPCGLGGIRCRARQVDLARHRRRLPGPLLDRLDILMRRRATTGGRALRAIGARVRRPPRTASSWPASASTPLTGQPETCNAAAHLTPDPRARPGHPERPAPARRASTTATRSPPAATHGSSTSPARVAGPRRLRRGAARARHVAASLRLDDTPSLAEAA